MVRMNISQFRLLIAEVDGTTEVVNRGKVIGVYTPTVSKAGIQGDAVPDKMGKVGRPKRERSATELVKDINEAPLDPGW